MPTAADRFRAFARAAVLAAVLASPGVAAGQGVAAAARPSFIVGRPSSAAEPDDARAPSVIRRPSAAADSLVVYRIESQPFGAAVRLVTPGGTVREIGTTPLDLRLDGPLDGILVVALGGYGEARIVPGREARNLHRVVLAPSGSAASAVVIRVRARPATWWIDALAFGVAAAGTVVAIDQKTRADRLYTDYRVSGDPDLRPPMKRYDTRAAIGLSAATVGLGVFTIRLARRR